MPLLNLALVLIGFPLIIAGIVLLGWFGTRLSEKDAERVRRLGEMWARGDDR
jgi:hypothetical protein